MVKKLELIQFLKTGEKYAIFDMIWKGIEKRKSVGKEIEENEGENNQVNYDFF